MVSRHGFFATVFDFSFTELVTARLVRAVYVLAAAGAGLLACAAFTYGMMQSPALGIVLLFGAGVAALIAVLLVRVWLETVVVLLRIADQTEEIAEQLAGIAVEVARGEGSAVPVGGKNRPS